MLWLLTLTACSAPAQDTLRFGLASAPVSLDPRFATDAASARINRLLYRRLVDFGDASRPAPSLAVWNMVSPLHYRFTLGREGRVFHDGSRLTARDVKATYDFILDTQNASPHRATLSMIARIEAPDDDTIDFHLNKQDALFPGVMTIGILPQPLIAAGHPFGQSRLAAALQIFRLAGGRASAPDSHGGPAGGGVSACARPHRARAQADAR